MTIIIIPELFCILHSSGNITPCPCTPRDLCQLTKCKSEGEMFTYFMSQRRSSTDMWHLVKCQVKTFISYPAAITHQRSAFSLKRPLRLGPPINPNKPWCWKVVFDRRNTYKPGSEFHISMRKLFHPRFPRLFCRTLVLYSLCMCLR